MRTIPISVVGGRATAVLGAAAIALATAGCSVAGSPAPADASAPTSAPGHQAAKGIVGKITTENAGTWTVVTAKGKQFTVTLTPQTRFGTAKAPGTQQQFTVGTTVRVSGTPDGTAVTATRVAIPAAHPAATPSAAPPG